MATWNSGYEADPQDSDDVSLGAGEIRSTRAEVRDRAEVEHDWGTITSGYGDTGAHVQGSGRVFVGATSPANRLKPDDSSQGVALGTGDVGRVWVDTSGIYYRVHYWTGTAWAGTAPTWNGFINGQFRVNQRTAFAAPETGATTATYWFDRWYTIHSTATGTVDRETSSLPTGSISPVGAKVIGGASCTAGRIGQRIEGARAQALGADRATNAFVTISGKVRNTGANALTANLVVASADALDNFSAVTAVGTSTGAVSALAAGASTTFTYTLDIGTASAGTPANGLDIYLVTTAPASFVATEHFVVTDWQIEVGSAATRPWPESFDEQLQLCRRFYQKSFPYGTKPTTGGGTASSFVAYADNSNNAICYSWVHQPPLRGTPTVTTYNPVDAASSWDPLVGGTPVAASSTPGASVTLLIDNGNTTAEYYSIHATASAEL